jgi:hypothetical protein
MRKLAFAAALCTAVATAHAHAQSLSGGEIGAIMYNSSVVLVAKKCPGLAATQQFGRYAHQLDNVPTEIKADIHSRIDPVINKMVADSPESFCRAAFGLYGPQGTQIPNLLTFRK